MDFSGKDDHVKLQAHKYRQSVAVDHRFNGTIYIGNAPYSSIGAAMEASYLAGATAALQHLIDLIEDKKS